MNQGPVMTADNLQDILQAFAGMPKGQPQAIDDLLDKALQVLTAAAVGAAATATKCFIGQVMLTLCKPPACPSISSKDRSPNQITIAVAGSNLELAVCHNLSALESHIHMPAPLKPDEARACHRSMLRCSGIQLLAVFQIFMSLRTAKAAAKHST